MKIEKNIVVSISYVLRNQEGGDIVEQTTNQKPLVFLFGSGMLLKKFEDNLENLQKGDSFKFHLTPEESYGQYQAQMVVNIPKSSFMTNGVFNEDYIYVGRMLPMQDNHGNHLNGLVVEISETDVKMDFNHPMAGKDLYFEGIVEDLREASKEEIEHGHVHHNGCCGGGCHGGCEGGCHCDEHEHEEGHQCCHGEGHEHEEGHQCCHGEGHCHHHEE